MLQAVAVLPDRSPAPHMHSLEPNPSRLHSPAVCRACSCSCCCCVPPRWYVPVSDYPSNASIAYTWGMATVLSADLVSLLAAGGVHLSMPPHKMLWMEDVAVGVMVAGVARQQNISVNYRGLIAVSTDRCRSRDAVTAELQAPVGTAMRCMHARDGRCCGNLTELKPSHQWVKAT